VGDCEWETVTGVTTMRIDAGLDTGEILMQREMAIEAEDTAGTLGPRLAVMGASLMVETLGGLEIGSVRALAQDECAGHAGAHFEEGRWADGFFAVGSEFAGSAARVQPWPGAFTNFKEKALSVHRARVVDARVAAGEIFG